VAAHEEASVAELWRGLNNVDDNDNSSNFIHAGAGESGKTTILRQMKLIHDGGFTIEERETFKEVIFSNTLQSMRVTMEAMATLHISFENPGNETYRRLVMEAHPQVDYLAHELVEAIAALWDDPAVQGCVARSNEFQLNDSAK
jgi:guanine nucleotide-binding protein subunit alpha